MAGRKPGQRVGREKKKTRQEKPRGRSAIPPIPNGAVRADPDKQVYGLGGPLLFYRDKERVCVQCQQVFVFSGREQRYWYEALGFTVYSTAIRCVPCRRRRRSDVTLQRQVAQARQSQRDNPQDPIAHLALVEALVLHHERLRTGRLEDAVAAARKAARLDPDLHEAVYWEAVSQHALGQEDKARELYQHFLDRAASVHRCRVLVKRVRRWLRDGSPRE